MIFRCLVVAMALASLAGMPPGIDHPKATDATTKRPWMRRTADANLPEVVSRRARLVVAYCGQCHSPPPPALHTSGEWRWMIVRMDMRAWASDRPSVHVARNDELEAIARYYDAFSDD